MKNQTENNRRKMERIPWSGNIQLADVATGRALVKGVRLQNIGRNGFSFQSGDRLVNGGCYRFTIQLGMKDLELQGQVRYLKNESVLSVGGAIVDKISTSHRSHLNRFLASQSKSFEWRMFTRSVLTGALAGAATALSGAGLLAIALALFLTPIEMFLWMPF